VASAGRTPTRRPATAQCSLHAIDPSDYRQAEARQQGGQGRAQARSIERSDRSLALRRLCVRTQAMQVRRDAGAQAGRRSFLGRSSGRRRRPLIARAWPSSSHRVTPTADVVSSRPEWYTHDRRRTEA
jgi:hypothetical protein